jgi:mannose-6-phosphate isomerase-like protein (cupin superfamily)
VAGSTIKNIKEIDDSAPSFGFAPDLEARFGRDPLECEQLGFSHQRLAPNFRLPFGHKHNVQEEVYVVVAGAGRVKLDDDVHDIRTWDAVRVSPGTTRGFEAGADGMELLVFGAPKTPPGDAEIIPGWWSD